MSEIFKARTGIRSKVGKKNIISNEIQTTNHKLGLTDGAQVTRLKIDHAESYIDVDPDKLWAGGWDSEIIEKPKILIRQTGDTLIAAIDESNLYHFNNLHSISPIEKNYDLNYFLVAYLNSKVGNFYYQTLTREVGRVLPQVDIDTLHQLPIVNTYTEYIDKFKNIISLEVEIDLQLDHINNLFFEIYNLTSNEIEYITNATKY